VSHFHTPGIPAGSHTFVFKTSVLKGLFGHLSFIGSIVSSTRLMVKTIRAFRPILAQNM
jgi:hypothetical protein